jgi:lantibiotic modifying enzyme
MSTSVSSNGRFIEHHLDDSDQSPIVATVAPLLRDVALKDVANIVAHFADATTDFAIYTGIAGAAIAALAIGDRQSARKLSKRAVKLARTELASPKARLTLIEGVAGAFVVGLMTAKHADELAECRQLLLDVWHTRKQDFTCYELLYGIGGYLAALIVAAELLPGDAEVNALITTVSAALLAGSASDDDCLRFTWHSKMYLGYAHGVSGIANVLLLAGVASPKIDATVGRLDELAKLQNGQMPSSNLKPSPRTELVQWCHGAPGFVALFLNAARADALTLCLDDVWARGLLTKGVGICHGASGAGMCFLAHFRATGDRKSLRRACHIAHECLTSRILRDGTMQGDDPYSLLNGWGARALFFAELSAELDGSTPALPRSLLHTLGLQAK